MELCISTPDSLRTLARSLLTAAKLADYVQFTPQPPDLHLRVLTSTHTVYAVFYLHPSFFASISLPPTAAPLNVPTKALLPLLRSPQSIASLTFRATDSHLQVSLITNTLLVKRFLVPVLDNHVASVRVPVLPGSLRIPASLLVDVLLNFHTRLDEISLTPAQSSFSFASFIDDAANTASAFLRTAVTLDARQLEQYTAPSIPAPLTVAARPFRVAVDFCDALNALIQVSFQQPGSPVALQATPPSAAISPPFEALFLFASRVTPNSTSNPPQPIQLPNNTVQAPARPLVSEVVTPTPTVTPVSPTDIALRREVRPTPITNPPSSYLMPGHVASDTTPASYQRHPPHTYELPNDPPPAAPFSIPEETRHPADDNHAPTPSLLRPMQNPNYVDDDGDDDDDDFVDATPPPSP